MTLAPRQVATAAPALQLARAPPAAGDPGPPCHGRGSGRAHIGKTHRGRRSRHRQRGSRGWTVWRRDAGDGKLKVCTLNTQSLKPKTVELYHELKVCNYDIMVLSETWLKTNYPTRMLAFPGYVLVRADRKFSPKGYGGVAILHRECLEVKKVITPSPKNPDCKLESLWCVFRLKRRVIVVGAVYRVPRYTTAALDADFDELESQYQDVILKYPGCAVVITGDLNCDLLADANTHLPRRKLSEFLTMMSLSQLIDQATYVTGSLLDVFIVNRDFSCIVGTRHCHFSPHRFIRMICAFPKPRKTAVTVRTRLLRRVDVRALHSDLYECDWSGVYASDTVTGMWDAFTAALLSVLDRHAPFRDIKLRNPAAPAISDTTRDLIGRRAYALRHFGHGSDIYRALNRAVRSAIRSDTKRDIRSDRNSWTKFRLA